MKSNLRFSLLVIGCVLQTTPVISGQTDSLRVVTMNVWSGLDYVGTGSMGEYESPTTREKRFQAVLLELRILHPHVIMLQEANPVGPYTARLADSLGYDELHQVEEAGVKFAGLGVPTNLNEGIAILAAPELSLRYERVAKLGGDFGLHGSVLSFHFSDASIALEGSIVWGGRRIRCINVHMTAMPIEEIRSTMRADPECAATLEDRISLQREQFESLAELLRQAPEETPFIIGGDFNTRPTEAVMVAFIRSTGVKVPSNYSNHLITWDGPRNPNIAYTTADVDARGGKRVGYDYYFAKSDSTPQRLDYILLSPSAEFAGGVTERLVCNDTVDGVYPSDHYGVAVNIAVGGATGTVGTIVRTPIADPAAEFFPILSYDTDAGFGYGAKGFLLNKLGMNESLDITAFNSTRGERWYRIVASFSDQETRQRTVYPLSIDVIVDYDKYIKNSYFGLGNASRYEDRQYFTREPLELSLVFGRGFTESLVVQGGIRFQYVRSGEVESEGLQSHASPALVPGIARAWSIVLAGRFDTRNSTVQPTHGWLVEAEMARAPFSSLGNVVSTQYHALVQHYVTLFVPTTVLALRARFQAIDGDIPLQLALPLGGNNTLRGFVQDRFLGKATVVANAELRFPIYGRFGGVAAVDAGNVWESLSGAGWEGVKWNPTMGLRFSMNTFVVRCDVGFGPETTGLYLNFGHIF